LDTLNVQLLIDEIVRQTTVLIAQLSTAAGLRAPLSHLADQVFVELARELDAQGVRRKVVADMFGMALRSYQMKVRRLSDNDKAGPSLWQQLYAELSAGSATRVELERRHKSHSPKQIAATLHDMVQSGLAYSAGRERD
jgi:predicted acetyltransferase